MSRLLMVEQKLYQLNQANGDIKLFSPLAMPKASGYLWNQKLLVQATCRGFVNSQFTQPEPAKYSKGPCLEATSFIQPEPYYYAHHPGRFFYIKDEISGEIFSAPYEPVKAELDRFEFTVSLTEISWLVEKLSIRIELVLSIPNDEQLEVWDLKVTNLSNEQRKLAIYPYFSIGYMSWMNQSAKYLPEHNAIVASCVTPYQKLEDYPKQKNFKDKTYLMSEKPIHSFCANQEAFEGEGGLSQPDEINAQILSSRPSQYETPAAVFQFRETIAAGESFSNRLLFGPMLTEAELKSVRTNYCNNPSRSFDNKDLTRLEYQNYMQQAQGCIQISTPDPELDHFVNHWLPRQIFYHGDVNRLTSDPQTRNYLQDHMGMSYIKPSLAKSGFINAISQQKNSGEMPDGILLHEQATLKYINQIPHADHNVWLPICLSAYLKETNDYDLLQMQFCWGDSAELNSIAEHIDRAMDFLLNARDERGLSYIVQGDWCDPMNMVGHKGKGVSAWLTMATSYALKEWSEICYSLNRVEKAKEYSDQHQLLNQLINQYFWSQQWFARGITDDGRLFGVEKDPQGKLFLNPQSWSILCNALLPEHMDKLLKAAEQQLQTPYGMMMLAPAFTEMREDIGRITQKSPGVAENGSVYNHAAIFYAFALYQLGQADKGYKVLKQMLPNAEDAIERGQLANFIPNYYRGAYHQFPEHAGRSSQLINTGTISWYYRCLVEGLFGVYGEQGELVIKQNLPSHWQHASIKRRFMGATFEIEFNRLDKLSKCLIEVDGVIQDNERITNIESGKCYRVVVNIPGEP